MKQRLLFLVRLYITIILIFLTQEVLFMLFNIGHADGAPFGACLAALLHGVKLHSVAACYLLILPMLFVGVSFFFRRFPLRSILSPYYVVASLLMALIFAADTVLYHFWGAKLDAADLMYAARPKDMLASLKWWSIVLIVMLLVLLVYHYYRRLRHATPDRLEAPRSRWSALVTLPVLGLLFLGMRGSTTESTANPSYAYFSQHQFCNHAALNPFFNMFHSLFKAQDLTHEFDLLPAEEVKSLAVPAFATDLSVTDTLLVCGRPDILMVVWEGGGWQVTMADSIAPNLMRLAEEGVVFSNCQANSFRTDRGLVSLFSGWMGLPTTSLMKRSDKCQRLPGLARELRRLGYGTRFVYGGDIDFTNMRGYMHETGFERVEGSETFAAERRLSNWGAPDAYTLVPSRMAPSSPSLTAILTLSSHEPWSVPMQRLADERLNSFAYADSCLGVLVESLRNTPRWDSLLVIIVPDHGIPATASQSTADPQVAHIPMVWTGGAVRGHKEVEVLMSQSDLAVTLLAQMLALERDESVADSLLSRFPFSRNVLSPAYASGYQFAMHSFKNGCNLFDTLGVARFDCADCSVVALQGDLSDGKRRFFQALIQAIYMRSGAL